MKFARRVAVPLRHWLAAMAMLGAVGAACDDALEETDGPPAPRLSLAINEEAPGSPLYTARVLVNSPVNGEFLGLSVPSGASIDFAGSTPATAFCAVARSEQAFEVTSTAGTASLTVVLGTWLSADGGPTLGPGSACATSQLFRVEESVVQSVPSNAASMVDANAPGLPGEASDATGEAAAPTDEGGDGDDGMAPADGSVSDVVPAEATAPVVDAAEMEGGDR